MEGQSKNGSSMAPYDRHFENNLQRLPKRQANGVRSSSRGSHTHAYNVNMPSSNRF